MNIKIPFIKKQQNKLMIFALSTVGLFVACIISISTLLMLEHHSVAWFSLNKKVNATGLQLTTESDILMFEDPVTVTKHFGEVSITTQYRQDADGNYYEYNSTDGTFVLDKTTNEKVPLHLDGLLPGQFIEITVSYKANKTLNYNLSLSGFDDTNGKFTVVNGTDAKEYSVLGIYRVSVLNGDTETDLGWLADYTAGTKKENVDLVKNGSIEAGVTLQTTFRISIDLEQYNKLEGTTSNLLSEKEITIGSICLDIVREENNS